jgi:hypothetical protein
MAKKIDWDAVEIETASRLIANYATGFGTSTDEKYRPKQVATCIAYAAEFVKQMKAIHAERENQLSE